MSITHIWDGLCSAAAAAATVAVCGLPCWFTYQAITAGIVPQWAWASVVSLGGVGAVLTLAFLRKALRGISPSRDRRRY